MTDVNIIIRTADLTRKAEVALSGSQTGADIIQAALDNWSLPKDKDYSLVNARTAKPVQPSESLDSQGVKDGDMLEIRSLSDAGPHKPSMRWTDKSQPAPRAPAVNRVDVVCPNCKASLRLPAERSGSMACPFCGNRVGAAK
jgi:hypothetical protein